MAAVSPTRDADLALARRASAGDRPAQREVFLAQRAGVHHTLYRILGAHRELEDLLQDAFLEIFRALPSYRGDSTLARWCQTITTRIAYLAISRRKPTSIDLELVLDHVAADDDTRREALLREATRRLYHALERIDAKQRIAFALAVIDERPLAEVAHLTRATVVAVKTRVWRARKDLIKRAAKDPILASYLADLTGRVS